MAFSPRNGILFHCHNNNAIFNINDVSYIIKAVLYITDVMQFACFDVAGVKRWIEVVRNICKLNLLDGWPFYYEIIAVRCRMAL